MMAAPGLIMSPVMSPALPTATNTARGHREVACHALGQPAGAMKSLARIDAEGRLDHALHARRPGRKRVRGTGPGGRREVSRASCGCGPYSTKAGKQVASR